MNVKSRILAIRLYDKIKKNPDYLVVPSLKISFSEKKTRRKM